MIILCMAVIVFFPLALNAGGKATGKPLGVTEFKKILRNSTSIAEKLKELADEICCNALSDYADGTLNIDELNQACKETWNETSFQDQLSIMLRQSNCISSELNELLERTQESIIDNTKQ